MRPTRELIFSLRYSSLIVLLGKNHSYHAKKLYVEKNDLKMTKNRILGHGVLTTFRKSHFSIMNIENNFNKVSIAKNNIENHVY